MPDTSQPPWPALLQRGIARHRAGDLPAAESLYRRVLELIPEQPDAVNLLGVIALQTGKIESALSLAGQACGLDPTNPSYHLSRGNALRAARQFAAAAEEFSTAIALRPDYAEAHNNLGLALADQNQHDPAVAAFRRAVALQPSLAMPRNNLAMSLRRTGRPAESADAARAAIAADPAFAPAHNTLANALLDIDQLAPAIAAFHDAIRLDPGYADAHANLCLAEYRAGHFDAAVAAGQTAVQLSPDSAPAHWNLAHALLIRGDLAAGFAEYEWRIHCPPPTCPPPLPPPPPPLPRHAAAQPPDSPATRWSGQPLSGQSILLQSEQGLGDTIQFIRFAKPLADRGATVLLQCPPPLVPLLRHAPGIAGLAEPGLVTDFFCPLMSLPHRLGITLASTPAEVPYLPDDPQRLEKWRSLIGTASDTLQVGLAWAGRRSHGNDRRRSIPLADLSPLAEVPGVRFHSLQVGEAAQQMRETGALQMIDHVHELKDFADTAALISQLDLVISVDTAVAHLAAAKGKPVWVLLPHVPDWRWMLDRPDSPWYPTMRLFRQERDGEWPAVVEKVAAGLKIESNRRDTETQR